MCHAPGAILSQAKDRKTGEPLVKGKRYTTFTDSEEKAAGGIDTIPELGETTLTGLGGILDRTEDWGAKVVVDGNVSLPGTETPASSQGEQEGADVTFTYLSLSPDRTLLRLVPWLRSSLRSSARKI